MTIEKSLRDHLSTVTAFIYFLVLPQDRTLPALTLQLDSSRRQYSVDGASHYPARFQVDCWADTYAQVKNLHSQVVARLNGYTGDLGDHYVDGVTIEQELDGYEADTKLYRVTVWIELFYRSRQ